MTIEERRCPHCGNRRTVRLGSWGSVCFNCRVRLDVVATFAVPVALPASQVFTPAELLRLESYRDAMLAGLYTDWPTQAELV